MMARNELKLKHSELVEEIRRLTELYKQTRCSDTFSKVRWKVLELEKLNRVRKNYRPVE